MNITTRSRIGVLGAAVVMAASSMTLTVGAAAAPPTSRPAASGLSSTTAAATIPSTCLGVLGRVSDGHFAEYAYRGGRFVATSPVLTLSFGGSVETPRTMTFVRFVDGVATYLAVRGNGSLWRVTVDGDVSTAVVHASGWGGVRHVSASANGDRLYALTTWGGLYRYRLNSEATPRGLGAIATSGWGGVKFLSASRSNAVFDIHVGVSTAGSLRQYAINRSTGLVNGGGIKPSGWGQITHLSVGPCATSRGAMMVGIHSSGAAYGYYDADSLDFRGDDITGIGQIGHGFSGLVFD